MIACLDAAHAADEPPPMPTKAIAALTFSMALAQGSSPMADIRFITLDPGHFHAALVQKEMYPGVSAKVNVYAPLGSDLVDHLARVAGRNRRPDNPTTWELEVHTGPAFRARTLQDHPGKRGVSPGRHAGEVRRGAS